MRQVVGFGVFGLLVVVGLFMALTCWTTVDSGQVGVVSTFGKVQEGYLDEGFHLKSPFSKVTPFDAKQKSLKETMGVPAQDQFITTVDISIQYRLIKEMAPKMLKETGSPQEVIEVHMKPLLRSQLREIGKSVIKSEDFFKQEVQQRIQAELLTSLSLLASKGIQIDQLLIRDLKLPKIITDAVARKKTMAQEAEAEKEQLKKFIVQQERKEREAEADKRAQLIQAQKDKEVALIKAEKDKEVNLINAQRDKEVALVNAEKDKQVVLIRANAQRDAAEVEAQSVLIRAEAEAEAKKKVIGVISQEGYLKLEAMKELGRLANGNHVFVMDGDSAQPLPFMNMTDMVK